MAKRRLNYASTSALIGGLAGFVALLANSANIYEFLAKRFWTAEPPQIVASETKKDKVVGKELTFWQRYPSLPIAESPKFFSLNGLTMALDRSNPINASRRPHPSTYAYAIDFVVQGEGDGEGTLHTIWIRCSEKSSSERVAKLCSSSAKYRRTHHLVRRW